MITVGPALFNYRPPQISFLVSSLSSSGGLSFYDNAVSITLSLREIKQFIQGTSVLMLHCGEHKGRMVKNDLCAGHNASVLSDCQCVLTIWNFDNRRKWWTFWMHVCVCICVVLVSSISQRSVLLNPCLDASTADAGRLPPPRSVISNAFDLLFAQSGQQDRLSGLPQL